jgi:hypothetical protein
MADDRRSELINELENSADAVNPSPGLNRQLADAAQTWIAEHGSAQQQQLYQTPLDSDWNRIDQRAVFRGQRGNPNARMMPGEFQAAHHRRLSNAVIVLDQFLPELLFADLQRLSREMATLTQGWSRPTSVRIREGDCSTSPGPFQHSEKPLGPELTRALNATLDHAIARLVIQLARLTTPPESIVHCNAWINTGPIKAGNSPKTDEYHFYHYDSDEYLEFWHPDPLLRFPIWAAVLYLDQPPDLAHYTLIGREGFEQRIRAVPNRLLIFDPSLVHGVEGPPTAEALNLRSVLVLNAWDYPAIDHGTFTEFATPTQETASP